MMEQVAPARVMFLLIELRKRGLEDEAVRTVVARASNEAAVNWQDISQRLEGLLTLAPAAIYASSGLARSSHEARPAWIGRES